MTFDGLKKWRQVVPFFIFVSSLLPWLFVAFDDLEEVQTANELIVPVLALTAAFFYVGLDLRGSHWKKENQKHVGQQIRTAVLSLIPTDLEVSETEARKLAEQEILRELTGVFWEAVDRDQGLSSHKQHFYSNGILYTTAFDVYLICAFAGISYFIAFFLWKEGILFYGGISLIAIALAARMFVIPRVRQRHLALSFEQLELLRTNQAEFVSARFRKIISQWRSIRVDDPTGGDENSGPIGSEGENLYDLTKHIRSTHLVLVLTSVLALLPALSSPFSQLALAQRQLQGIMDVLDDWERWPARYATEQTEWLMANNREFAAKDLRTVPAAMSIGPEELARQGIDYPKGPWMISIVDSPMSFSVFPETEPGRTNRRVLVHTNGVEFIGRRWWGLPGTLGDFRSFWNAASLMYATVVTRVLPYVYAIERSRLVAELNWAAEVPPTDAEGVFPFEVSSEACDSARSFALRIANVRKLSDRPEVLCGQVEGYAPVLAVIVETRSFRVGASPKLWLAQEFDWGHVGGNFEQAFPDLSAFVVEQHYIDRELNVVADILAKAEGNRDRSLSFLGLEVPETVLSNWGTVIIFAVQAYLLIHLRELDRRLRLNAAGVLFPWIGLFRDRWARIASVATVSFLPFIAAVSLTAVTGSSKFAFLMCCLVAVLALLSAASLWGCSGYIAFQRRSSAI